MVALSAPVDVIHRLNVSGFTVIEAPAVVMEIRCGSVVITVETRADIEQAGARVVAVSTELPEHAGNTKEKNKLGFAVLSDPEAVASRAFGVAWANERYGPGLERYNGNDKGEIPLGVTYLIDTNATIRWAFLEDDYKKRATPDQAIEAINALD